MTTSPNFILPNKYAIKPDKFGKRMAYQAQTETQCSEKCFSRTRPEYGPNLLCVKFDMTWLIIQNQDLNGVCFRKVTPPRPAHGQRHLAFAPGMLK